MTRRRSNPGKPPHGRTAQLAREIRLLVAPALGDWNKVLQLGLLLVLVIAVVTAGCVLIVSTAGDTWPVTLLLSHIGTAKE